MSEAEIARPAGTPSRTASTPGPCDSPAVSNLISDRPRQRGAHDLEWRRHARPELERSRRLVQQHEQAVHHAHMLSLARTVDQRRLPGDGNEVGDDRGKRIERESVERVLALHPERRRVDERIDPVELARLIPADRAEVPARLGRHGRDETLGALDGTVRDEDVVPAPKLEHARASRTTGTEHE